MYVFIYHDNGKTYLGMRSSKSSLAQFVVYLLQLVRTCDQLALFWPVDVQHESAILASNDLVVDPYESGLVEKLERARTKAIHVDWTEFRLH